MWLSGCLGFQEGPSYHYQLTAPAQFLQHDHYLSEHYPNRFGMLWAFASENVQGLRVAPVTSRWRVCATRAVKRRACISANRSEAKKLLAFVSGCDLRGKIVPQCTKLVSWSCLGPNNFLVHWRLLENGITPLGPSRFAFRWSPPPAGATPSRGAPNPGPARSSSGERRSQGLSRIATDSPHSDGSYYI